MGVRFEGRGEICMNKYNNINSFISIKSKMGYIVRNDILMIIMSITTDELSYEEYTW